MTRRHGGIYEADTWFVYINNQALTYSSTEAEAQDIFERELEHPGSVIPWRKGKKPHPCTNSSTTRPNQTVARNNRRAARLGAPGIITSDEWERLCQHFGNYCIACGFPWKLTIDHVVPLVRGGRNDISNIQPLCHGCNSMKHTHIIDYRLQPAQRRLLD